MTSADPTLAAVILAGGEGARLGGVDKAAIEVHGITLLEHALAATSGAAQVVVVGTEVPASRPVTWTREDPPGGGPAAGLLTGIHAFARRPEHVCVLAVDMPRFTAATLERLREVTSGAADAGSAGRELPDGACLVDRRDRKQWLAGVYHYDALVSAAVSPGSWHGLSVRRLMMPLRIEGVPAVDDEARDVDTWEDLTHLRD